MRAHMFIYISSLGYTFSESLWDAIVKQAISQSGLQQAQFYICKLYKTIKRRLNDLSCKKYNLTVASLSKNWFSGNELLKLNSLMIHRDPFGWYLQSWWQQGAIRTIKVAGWQIYRILWQFTQATVLQQWLSVLQSQHSFLCCNGHQVELKAIERVDIIFKISEGSNSS